MIFDKNYFYSLYINNYASIIVFTIKSIILTTLIFFTFSSIFVGFSNVKIGSPEKNKLFLIGLIQSPHVLWRLSEIEENKDEIKKSLFYIETAIGIMEMHGASEKALNKYFERIKYLKSKL